MNFLKRLFRQKQHQPDFATLTGDWIGHYAQYDARSRIAATIVQDGISISGHMRDLDTQTTRSLYAAVAHAGLPPGTDENLDKQIRNMIPNTGGDPIVVRSILPADAVLVGTVNGEFVRITKTYQGKSFHGYEIGETGIGYETPGHSVEYSGRISQDRMKIIGNWMIYQKDSPRGFIDGSFELSRLIPDTDS